MKFAFKMKNILVTGATGFLGSHIAEELVNQGFNVIALKRSTSNLWRCESFKDQIKWINCDIITDAEPEIFKCKPEVIIHAAWNGVKSSDRDNWVEQEKNVSFFVSLLEIARKAKISKIIALGSQAEYGNFEGSINEEYPCNPNSAYGAIKLCISILLKSFAEQNKIDWYWIRIFSVFGPREELNWLLPATINNLLEKKEMGLTPCEQRYDYLFTKDFAAGILNIAKNNKDNSGTYIISSSKSIKLKDILSFLENKISPQLKLLKFGALPYRPHQVMHMEGNSDRFFQTFNFQPKYDLNNALVETINYYINLRNNE